MTKEKRLWIHEGPGHWIGSLVMCFAETEEDAAAMIRSRLDEYGLKKEPLRIRWVAPHIGIFHFDNGDY